VHLVSGNFIFEGSLVNSNDIDLNMCQYLLGVTYIERGDFEKAIDALVEPFVSSYNYNMIEQSFVQRTAERGATSQNK